MTRKIGLACVLALLGSLLPVGSSVAAPPDPPDLPEFAENARTGAILESKDGSIRVSLTPLLVEAVEIEEGVYELIYEVGIPSSEMTSILGQNSTSESEMLSIASLFPSVAYASSDSHNGCDSTVSACAQVVLYYTQIADHGWYQYATSKWTLQDPTVSWSNAKIIASCSAEWHQGSGRCSSQVTRFVGAPSSGTSYSITPWFSGSSYDLSIDVSNGIGAFQWIDLHRGGSDWQFTFCVAVGGGSWHSGCY